MDEEEVTRFITYRETDAAGNLQYYILQKNFPHFTGLISQTPIVNFITPVPVTSYALWICFAGSIRGSMIPSYRNVADEITQTMQEMALWFFEKRIMADPKKYRKWKIVNNIN